MENAESVTTVLLQIRDLGIKLLIDDFGTGYSSLSYLHRFPINTLKIDRSFVSRMSAGDANLEITNDHHAGPNLGMEVMAEGIETAEQLTHLKLLKCEYGQGYLFSKPMDSKHARTLIATTPPSPKKLRAGL